MVEDGELANCERAEPVELDKMSIFDIAREAEGSKAYFPASKEGRRSHKLLRNAYRHFRDVTDMDVKDGDHLAVSKIRSLPTDSRPGLERLLERGRSALRLDAVEIGARRVVLVIR